MIKGSAKVQQDGTENPRVPKSAYPIPRALVALVLTFVMIGLVAKLIQSFYFHRVTEDGTDILAVVNSYGNIVSAFAYPLTVFAGIIIASRALSMLLGGEDYGMIALAFAFGLTLLAFTAEATQFALSDTEVHAKTRAWEGLAFVVGALAVLMNGYQLGEAKKATEAGDAARAAENRAQGEVVTAMA